MSVVKFKLKHFYLNKYLITLFSKKKYFLSYNYKYKAIWYRTYKVASRTIDHHLKQECEPGEYIYASAMGYIPSMFSDYFKFAFVRNPENRFRSAWKDKVLRSNYFGFEEREHERMKDINHFISWVETLDVKNCDEHLMAQSSLVDMNNIDFLGRFEFFQEDFSYVAKKIGLKDFDTSQKLNKTEKIPDQEFTFEQRSRIFNIYRKDFEIFYPEHHNTLKP